MFCFGPFIELIPKLGLAITNSVTHRSQLTENYYKYILRETSVYIVS